EYRELIIKTLAYDPQILKRYVNFMNNPDEDTAITQFGSDGKYFGICTLMATLPGLPMFGHGQIEGFTEKYGMEYQRAYYNEKENQLLIDRHQKEIFPLLHKRYLFAEVDYFTLYNMINLDGSVNENVYAYSNRSGYERALVLYQNNWGTAQGNIHFSADINKTSISLLDGLGFNVDEGDYLLFKEQISGLEYIRSIRDLSSRGLSVSLGAYQYQVFLDFKLVPDTEGAYRRLAEYLNGNGVLSLQETLLDIKYAPLADIYTKLLSRYQKEQIIQPEGSEKSTRPRRIASLTFADMLPDLWTICNQTFPDFVLNQDNSNQVIFERLSLLKKVSTLFEPDRHLLFNFCFLTWIFAAETQAYIPPDLLLYLPELIAKHAFFDQPEFSEIRDEYSTNLGLLLTLASSNINLESGLLSITELWFNHPVFSHHLDVHSYDGQDWYKKEALEILLDLTLGLIYLQNRDLHKEISSKKTNILPILKSWRKTVHSCMKKSRYQVILFQELITSSVTSR
ncbi:MAG: hypothetical protein MUP11_02670, partial [Anaerolineales bacterium]|nr:hypothetical protein [Anaerolineales bacterium]